MSEMAAVFWGSAKMSFSLMKRPRNVTCLLLNSHFLALRVTSTSEFTPMQHWVACHTSSGPFPKLGCHQWGKGLHWAHQIWRWFVSGSVEMSLLIKSARTRCWHLAGWRQQHQKVGPGSHQLGMKDVSLRVCFRWGAWGWHRCGHSHPSWAPRPFLCTNQTLMSPCI